MPSGHVPETPTEQAKPLIKTSRSHSYSGNLHESESLHSLVPIQVIGKPTKLDYVIQNYKILSTTHIILNFRVSNYNFSSIIFKDLTITPLVQINLEPATIKIKKVELPLWNDYLNYELNDGKVKFTCHENTSLEFFGCQLFATLPITISVTFSINKCLPKIGSFGLSAALSETAELGEITETETSTPLSNTYHGSMFEREFHLMRAIKQKNVLGSSPQSFVKNLIECLNIHEVKTILVMQMKNHFIQSLHKEHPLALNSKRLDEFKNLNNRLQKCRSHSDTLIEAALTHCLKVHANRTRLKLLLSDKTIDLQQMLDIVRSIDAKSFHVKKLTDCKLGKSTLKTAIKVLLNDPDTIIDYLSNNLQLICSTPNIMIAWAIGKNTTLRIWEYHEQNKAGPEKQIYLGQHHLVEKQKSLEVLHDNTTNTYHALSSTKTVERFLKTPLALRLRLFGHKPATPSVQENETKKVQFSLES